MKRLLIAVALVGLGVIIALNGFIGLGDISGALRAVGWGGLIAICVIHLFQTAVSGLAWAALQPGAPPARSFIAARWVRDAVNNIAALIPTAGEIVGARYLALRGMAGGAAGAGVVVDLTIELLSQLAFALIGLGLLHRVMAHPPNPVWIELGLVLGMVAVTAFAAAQRAGLFILLERLSASFVPRAWRFRPGISAALHREIDAIYGQRGRVSVSFALHLIAWALPSLETWLALRLMGQMLAGWDVLILESLVSVVRSAGFVVPWAAGLQEGAYIGAGAVFGIDPGTALALSLLRRGRDLALGVPALAVWHWLEAKRLRSGAVQSGATPSIPLTDDTSAL